MSRSNSGQAPQLETPGPCTHWAHALWSMAAGDSPGSTTKTQGRQIATETPNLELEGTCSGVSFCNEKTQAQKGWVTSPGWPRGWGATLGWTWGFHIQASPRSAAHSLLPNTASFLSGTFLHLKSVSYRRPASFSKYITLTRPTNGVKQARRSKKWAVKRVAQNQAGVKVPCLAAQPESQCVSS